MTRWDPIFQPDGHNLTYAELPKEVKDSISHRARSLRLLRDHFRETHRTLAHHIAANQSRHKHRRPFSALPLPSSSSSSSQLIATAIAQESEMNSSLFAPTTMPVQMCLNGTDYVIDKVSRKYDLSSSKGAERLRAYQLRCSVCGMKSSMFCSLCSDQAAGDFLPCCSIRTKRGCWEKHVASHTRGEIKKGQTSKKLLQEMDESDEEEEEDDQGHGPGQGEGLAGAKVVSSAVVEIQAEEEQGDQEAEEVEVVVAPIKGKGRGRGGKK